jgi:exopolysaccharide production protein ExoY
MLERWPALAEAIPADLGPFLHFAAAMVLALAITGNYGAGDARRSFYGISRAALIGSALMLWVDLWTSPFVTLAHFIGLSLTAILGLGLERLTIDRLYRITPVAHSGAKFNCLLIGEKAAIAVAEQQLIGIDGLTVAGRISPTESGDLPTEAGGVERTACDVQADTLLLCGPLPDLAFRRAARASTALNTQLITLSARVEQAGVQPEVIWKGGTPMLSWRRPSLRWAELAAKRLLDIIGSSILLVLGSPIMAVIAVLIRTQTGGSAIFAQDRLGRHGRPFRCYKFRSMYPDAEQRLRDDPALFARYVSHGYKLPAELDPRVTPIGRVLRAWSLDELPQLWNVLRGDMSLVGPRPIVRDEIHQYDEAGLFLLALRPGMTGSWQVSGRSHLTYPARARVELEYIAHWSILRDLWILLQTIPAVLRRRGAY